LEVVSCHLSTSYNSDEAPSGQMYSEDISIISSIRLRD
jgi:hypothetical protein